MSETDWKTDSEPTYCPICKGQAETTLRFIKDEFHIRQCRSCGLLFVYPQPSQEQILGLYGADYFKRGEKYSTDCQGKTSNPNEDNDIEKIHTVQRYRTSGRLLDVGCALGGFLRVASENGFEVAGVEVSESASGQVRRRFGFEVVTSDLPNAGLPPSSFDVITLWDVLEHLADPQATLREAHRLLRPDGILFASTGDVASKYARLMGRRWHLLTPPQHLFYYTPESLRRILADTGFVAKEILYPGKRATVGFILFKAGEAFGPLIGPLKSLAGMLRLDKAGIYINLRDIMTCIADKVEKER